jgi:hypothetical protein
MKQKYVIILLLIVLTIGFIWWLRPNGQSRLQNAEPNTDSSEGDSAFKASVEAEITNHVGHQLAGSKTNDFFQQRAEQMKLAGEDANDEWRTPIEFFGKVVDENDNPLAGSTISYSWNNLMGTQTSVFQSDTQGLFSLHNEQGKFLSVKASKEGYYEFKPQGEGFFYAGRNENFIADANNPIVFRLHKKGKAEPLIVSGRTVSISISGKPLELNLKTGQVVPVGQGDLMLEFVRTPLALTTNRHVFDWSLKITPRNGGLVTANGEFAFIAPDDGYRALEFIDMPVLLREKWMGRLTQQYFLKFSNGQYARVHIDLMPYNGSLKIDSFYNPAGSRNLEYDQAVQPKPTVSE